MTCSRIRTGSSEGVIGVPRRRTLTPEIFLSRLKEAVSLNHFFVGMIKAPFMAFMIGIIACAEGLRVKGSAESLGTHTTASVVKSVFLVIVLDGLFAMFFASIGK